MAPIQHAGAELAFPLTVYYDASCPICASEMHTLKARDANDVLLLADCSSADFDERSAASEGVTRTMMLKRIHARDAKGRWLSGTDVFVAVYRAAGFPRVARMLEKRGLRPLFDRVYPWIAANRRWLSRIGLSRLFNFATPLSVPNEL